MPFCFEKLTIYQKTQTYLEEIFTYFKTTKIDYELKDQLKRASISISLNIAEGSGRFSKADKKNFYIISRGSIYESIAVLQILKRLNQIEDKTYQHFYNTLEQLSKMVNAMINSLSSK